MENETISDNRINTQLVYKEIFCESYKFSNNCSAFQAEYLALVKAINWIKLNAQNVGKLGIFSNSLCALNNLIRNSNNVFAFNIKNMMSDIDTKIFFYIKSQNKAHDRAD